MLTQNAETYAISCFVFSTPPPYPDPDPNQVEKRFKEFLTQNMQDYSVPMAQEVLTEHKKLVDAAKIAGKVEPPAPGILGDGRVYLCTATVCATAFCGAITSALHFKCKHPLCMRCYSGLMTAASDRPEEEWGFVVQRRCPLCRASRLQQPDPVDNDEEDDVILMSP